MGSSAAAFGSSSKRLGDFAVLLLNVGSYSSVSDNTELVKHNGTCPDLDAPLSHLMTSQEAMG